MASPESNNEVLMRASQKAALSVFGKHTYETHGNHRYHWHEEAIQGNISPFDDTAQHVNDEKPKSCRYPAYLEIQKFKDKYPIHFQFNSIQYTIRRVLANSKIHTR